MSRNATTETLLQALLAASEDRKQTALAMLRGDPEPERSTGRGRLPEPYVGRKEVAEFLRVSKRTVWRWKVPGHRFGGRIRFRLSEVAGYVESEEFRRRTEELQEARAGMVKGNG